jgi:hypothetical protein
MADGHAGTGIPECYSFENSRPAGKMGRARHISETAHDVNVLIKRLGLDEAYQAHFRQELADFVVHHHLNIRWYDAAIRREVCLRRAYFFFNLILLAAIPFGVYFATKHSDGNVESISAVLAGLLGVQRSLTGWLDKRQLAALYSKTRAKLKTAVYTFEQTWRHGKLLDTDFLAFGAALEAATNAARATVSEEQDQHYEIEAAPTFGLDDMLTSAAASAKNLTGQLAAKESPEAAAKREAEAKVREQDALIQEYQRLSAQKRDALSRTTDAAERQRLIDEINDNSAKQRSAELERAIALSKLTAATA